MKDEIKEILQDVIDDIYQSGEYIGQAKKLEKVLDCINNLQEKLNVSQTNEETYRLEMQDITKILGLDEHTTFDEVKEYASNLQEEHKNCTRKHWQQKCAEHCANEMIYKSRNEKAIEYGNNCLENIEEYDEYMCESIDIVGLLRMIHKNYIDILQGEENDN